jgi:hypothetical protein
VSRSSQSPGIGKKCGRRAVYWRAHFPGRSGQIRDHAHGPAADRLVDLCADAVEPRSLVDAGRRGEIDVVATIF